MLRWTTVATHFVLFCVVMAMLGPGYGNLIAYIAPLWFGVIAIQFIFTISEEARREKQELLPEKGKRQRLEIGDDGELIEFAEEEGEQKRKRQGIP